MTKKEFFLAMKHINTENDLSKGHYICSEIEVMCHACPFSDRCPNIIIDDTNNFMGYAASATNEFLLQEAKLDFIRGL